MAADTAAPGGDDRRLFTRRPAPLQGTTARTAQAARDGALGALPLFDPASPHCQSRATEFAVVVDRFTLTHRESGVRVLQPISFAVPRGSLFAIIGESGAGKTTLLRFLARRLRPSALAFTGEGLLPTNTWFIPQEQGALFEHDTPLGVVAFLHRLVHGSDAATAEDEARRLLAVVKLRPASVDATVGDANSGLSAGQRRLVGVASALCAKADVLLLDEVTTGLDSTTCRAVVGVLREVTEKFGVTCISTIHQPSDEVMGLFDDVLVLRRHGSFQRAVFDPAMLAAGSFADHFLTAPDAARWDAVPGAAAAQLAALEERSLARQYGLTAAAGPADAGGDGGAAARAAYVHSRGVGAEVALLTQRTFMRQACNPFSLPFRLAANLFLAVVIGFAFFQVPYDDPTYFRDHLGWYIAVVATNFLPLILNAGSFEAQELSLTNELNQSKSFRLGSFLVANLLSDLLVGLLSSLPTFINCAVFGIAGNYGELWFSVLMTIFVLDALGFAGPFVKPRRVVAVFAFQAQANAVDFVNFAAAPRRTAKCQQHPVRPAIIAGKITEREFPLGEFRCGHAWIAFLVRATVRRMR